MNDRERVRGAVGLIETEGLPAAIAAADAALKAANVVLVGRENSRGGGFMTVKIAGDVAAVQAALAAARAVAEGVRGVHSVLTIPRPAEGIGDCLVRNENTMGAELLKPAPPAPAPCGAKEAPDAAGEGPESEAERDAELPKEDRAPRSGEAGLAVAGPRALMKVQPAAPAEAEDSTTVEVAGGAEAVEAAPEPAEDEAKKPRKRRSTTRRKPR